MRCVEVNWIKDRYFEAVNEEGGKLGMDIPKAKGGSGEALTPVETVQAAMGGCAGIDMVNILTKMRQKVSSIKIVTESTQAPEHPMYFDYIKLTFYIEGENLMMAKVAKAIDLSMNKYCSVKASLADKCKIDTEIVIK